MTDYFEEKVINHVLSFRTRPDGVWNQYTAEQLTSKLVEASIAVQQLGAELDPVSAMDKINEIFEKEMAHEDEEGVSYGFVVVNDGKNITVEKNMEDLTLNFVTLKFEFVALELKADKEKTEVNCCFWDCDGQQEFTLNIKQCYELIEFLNDSFDMGYRRV